MNIWQKFFLTLCVLAALSTVLDALTHPFRTIGAIITVGLIAFVVYRGIKSSNL